MPRQNIASGKKSQVANAHSASIRASGEFLFTSGITPRDENGDLVGAGDMAMQIRQTLSNLEDVLQAGGAGFGDVVKFTVFVTDIESFVSARRGGRYRAGTSDDGGAGPDPNRDIAPGASRHDGGNRGDGADRLDEAP